MESQGSYPDDADKSLETLLHAVKSCADGLVKAKNTGKDADQAEQLFYRSVDSLMVKLKRRADVVGLPLARQAAGVSSDLGRRLQKVVELSDSQAEPEGQKKAPVAYERAVLAMLDTE